MFIHTSYTVRYIRRVPYNKLSIRTYSLSRATLATVALIARDLAQPANDGSLICQKLNKIFFPHSNQKRIEKRVRSLSAIIWLVKVLIFI